MKLLIDADAIARRTAAMAAELDALYGGREVVALGVLNGAVFFCADLVRAMRTPVILGFVEARSYEGTCSTGTVQIVRPPDLDVHGRDVLIVEDIIDTGRTASCLRELVDRRGAASVRIVSLLDKPARRTCGVAPDLAGFEIDDVFVVGWGLDYNGRYRTLPGIYETGGDP